MVHAFEKDELKKKEWFNLVVRKAHGERMEDATKRRMDSIVANHRTKQLTS